MKKPLRQPYRQFFGTLANQVRIDIIKELVKGSRNVSKLVENLGYEQSTISHNLKRLEVCGFVTVKKEGKERKYSLNQETIKPLFKLMDKHMENHCNHVVRRRKK